MATCQRMRSSVKRSQSLFTSLAHSRGRFAPLLRTQPRSSTGRRAKLRAFARYGRTTATPATATLYRTMDEAKHAREGRSCHCYVCNCYPIPDGGRSYIAHGIIIHSRGMVGPLPRLQPRPSTKRWAKLHSTLARYGRTTAKLATATLYRTVGEAA